MSASKIVGYSTWVRWVVSTNIMQFNEFEYHFACRRKVVHLCFITSPGKMILYITHMCGSYILSVPHRMLIWFSGLKSTKYNQILLKSHCLLTFSIVYGQFWPEVLWCSQNGIIYAYEYDQLGDVEWVAVERLKSAYIYMILLAIVCHSANGAVVIVFIAIGSHTVIF